MISHILGKKTNALDGVYDNTDSEAKSDRTPHPKKTAVCLLIFCVAFFLFFMFADGPRLEKDSDRYLNALFARNAELYPLFIKLCRLIPLPDAGAYEGYTGVYQALFLQSLLWGYAVWRMGFFVREISGSFLMGVLAVCAELAVCLLNRFASGMSALYSSSILTEALAMPLFLIFIMYCFYFVNRKKTSDLLKLFLLTFLLIGLRGQMQAVLIIWALLGFIYRLLLKRTRDIKLFLISVALMAAAYASGKLFTCTLNYAWFNTFESAGNSEAVLCNLLYTQSSDETSLFTEDEEQEKEWYIKIREMQLERGAIVSAVPEDADIFERQNHYAESYDVIGYEIVHTVILETAYEKHFDTYAEHIAYMYASENRLTDILMRQELTGYVSRALENFICALACTNARFTKELLPVSLIFYLIYIIFIALILAKKYGKTYGSDAVRDRILTFSVTVIIAVLVNAAVVSLTIFPQARYMIYCMGLFYTAFMLMFVCFIKSMTAHKNTQ